MNSQREARRANMRRLKLPAPAKGRGKVQQACLALAEAIQRPFSTSEANAWAESTNAHRALRSLQASIVGKTGKAFVWVVDTRDTHEHAD